MAHTHITAALVVIGNEVLSGRTQDKNIHFLAGGLGKIGVQLLEVRIIPDVESTIIETVNHLRRNYNYVFTTGGIGPTHDDITSASVAKAFGVKLIRHQEAEQILLNYYSEQDRNEARMKMADIPETATLIANPVSAAPGFRIENVYVLAGVPRIMQAMFDGIKHELKGGAVVESREVSAFITEGSIAVPLGDIQTCYPEVEIGSYPFIRNGKLGTSVVLRSADIKMLESALEEVKQLMSPSRKGNAMTKPCSK